MTPSFFTTLADGVFDNSRAAARVMLQAWAFQLEELARYFDAGRAGWGLFPPHEIVATPALPTGHPMYNLYKAKTEIDAVAKHTLDLAVHVLGKSQDLDAKLERFKTEIMSLIDAKFADLEHTILGGNDHNIQSSAIDDLGAKVSLLVHGPILDQPIYVDTYADQGHHSQPNDTWHSSNHYN